MSLLIEMAEHGLLPDRLIRFGIRQLDKKRLQEEDRGDMIFQRRALDSFISDMHQSPIAIQTDKANQQHYEVPPAFFEQVLGRYLKYSGCYWPDGVENLDQAEERMLDRVRPQVGEMTPIYLAEAEALADIVGFPFHRGVLACAVPDCWPPCTPAPKSESQTRNLNL